MKASPKQRLVVIGIRRKGERSFKIQSTLKCHVLKKEISALSRPA